MNHATVITKEARDDGDIGAVVINIPNTGFKGVASQDKYRYTIEHGLRRDPVGCIIQWADKECNLWVDSENEHSITVYFTTHEANVNVRIW